MAVIISLLSLVLVVIPAPGMRVRPLTRHPLTTGRWCPPLWQLILSTWQQSQQIEADAQKDAGVPLRQSLTVFQHVFNPVRPTFDR